MKNIFLVAGEVSGDKTGGWYLDKLKQSNINVNCQAVGGSFLKKSGAKLYDRLEKLNIAGIFEILFKLRFIFGFLKKLASYILKNDFDEIVLIDFPGFNLRLAKILKKANPNLKITYLSPPQLWVWGKWRIKKLKKYCDKVIVLYPFEVDWYKKNGLEVEYLGNPVFDKIKKYDFFKNEKKYDQIAIIPGSRQFEVYKMLPIFLAVAKKFKLAYPKIKIILPLAESLSSHFIEEKIKKFGFYRWGNDIKIVRGEKEKLKELSKCCFAITKVGTVSLEVALLGIPAVVLYKGSWITYFLARSFIKIKYMALPNLFLEKSVYPEFIQWDCKPDKIFNKAKESYKKGLIQRESFKDLYDQFLIP
ncbi:lipid-A-disaccharide synthase [Candidatus Dependentiae bacterium]